MRIKIKFIHTLTYITSQQYVILNILTLDIIMVKLETFICIIFTLGVLGVEFSYRKH